MPDWVGPDFARATGLEDLMALRTDEAGPSRRLATRQRHAAVFAPMHMGGVTTSERMHARYGQAFADPWSARPLAELALAVPPRVLNTASMPKRLTRLAMKGVMPEGSREALRKILPTDLFRRGLRERETEAVRTLLTDSLAERRGYLRPDGIPSPQEGTSAGLDPDTALWRALTLELWLRRVCGPR
jgi:hypothetical protein